MLEKSVFVVCVQLGNVIAANIYVADDAPLYHRGNTSLIIINILVIGLFVATKVYYVSRNRYRERKWNTMTMEVCLFCISLCLLYENAGEKIYLSIIITLPVIPSRNASPISIPPQIRETRDWTFVLRTQDVIIYHERGYALARMVSRFVQTFVSPLSKP